MDSWETWVALRVAVPRDLSRCIRGAVESSVFSGSYGPGVR